MDFQTHFQNECQVSGILGHIIRMSQLFGVAPLRIEYIRNMKLSSGLWNIRVSKTANFYDKVLILITCLLTTISISWDIMTNAKMTSYYYSTPIKAVMFIGMAFVISCALLAQAFSGMSRIRGTITSLAQLRKINTELSMYITPISDEKSKLFWTLWTLIGGFAIMLADYSAYLFYSSHANENLYIQILYVTHYMKYAMLKVLTVQITLIFTSALSSFNHLNYCLKNLLDQILHENAQGLQTPQLYPDPSVVQRLGVIYCCLCDVVHQLDQSHGIVLVPIVGAFLLHLVVTSYNFMTRIFALKMDILILAIQVGWAVYHSTDIIMIVEPCHQTQRQMDRTKQLISQIIRVCPPEYYRLIAEFELFYKHVMVYEPSYAPINLFQLNRALLITIIGSVTTYLVVVIKL